MFLRTILTLLALSISSVAQAAMSTTSSPARRAEIIVDFAFAEVRFRGEGYTRIFPAVLPRPGAQRHVRADSVHGVVEQIDHQPTWWPTPRMRRDDPTLPEAIRYGESGHPLGLYRIRIQWQAPASGQRFWQFVRIHGGAQEEDLYRPLSSGCIRLLNAHVAELVSLIRQYDEVRVTFGHDIILASTN